MKDMFTFKQIEALDLRNLMFRTNHAYSLFFFVVF